MNSPGYNKDREKMSARGTEITQVLQERLFLRQALRVTILETPVICSSISGRAQKMHRSFMEDGSVLGVIGKSVFSAQLVVGGGRNQMDLGEFDFRKSRWPG